MKDVPNVENVCYSLPCNNTLSFVHYATKLFHGMTS